MKYIKKYRMLINLIIFTFAFVLVLIAYLYLTHDYETDIWTDITKEILFAFIVAGLAGLFFETLVKSKFIDEIMDELKIDRDLMGINIKKVYTNRKEESFKNDLIKNLNNTHKGNIFLLGIALIDFFDDDTRREPKQIEFKNAFIKCINNDKVCSKILFANPYNKRTFGYRYIFEESKEFKIVEDNKTPITRPYIDMLLNRAIEKSDTKKKIVSMISKALEQYNNITTSNANKNNNNDNNKKYNIKEFFNSLKTNIKKNQKDEDRMLIRLYNPHPLCFLIMINDTMYIEPYTLAGKGSEKNIVIQVKKPSELFDFYEKHFNRLWYISDYCKVSSTDELEKLEKMYLDEEELLRTVSKCVLETSYCDKFIEAIKTFEEARELKLMQNKLNSIIAKSNTISLNSIEMVEKNNLTIEIDKKYSELNKRVSKLSVDQKNIFDSLNKMI